MRNYSTKVAMVVTTALLSLTLGCGASHSPMTASPTTYVYVAMADEIPGAVGCLAQFKMSNSGTLTPLSPATLGVNESIPFGGFPLAVDPSGGYLFVVGFSGVSQFVIANDGTVAPNATPRVSNTMIDPNSIAFTPSGLAILTNGVALDSYSLTVSGTLDPLNTAPVTNANSFTIGPSGRFLYIDDEAYSHLMVYGISPSGTLTFNGAVPSEMYPWSLVFSPKGILYSVDYGAGTITQYSTDPSTGVPMRVRSFATGLASGTSLPQGMAFGSRGSFAYVTNENENTISQFAVDANTGALTRNGADVPTHRAPSTIAVDPSGRFVFVGSLLDGTISEFTINENGTLIPNGVITAITNPLNPNTLNFPVAISFAQR